MVEIFFEMRATRVSGTPDNIFRHGFESKKSLGLID
jgi:hypothetical protein